MIFFSAVDELSDAELDKQVNAIQSFMADSDMLKTARKNALKGVLEGQNSGTLTAMAKGVKVRMDQDFGPRWQVAVGTQYGIEIDLPDGNQNYLFAQVGQYYVMMIKPCYGS